VNRENFVYYLKELEVRYNYRDNVEDNLYICLDGIKWEITLYKILPYVKYSFTEIENLIELAVNKNYHISFYNCLQSLYFSKYLIYYLKPKNTKKIL